MPQAPTANMLLIKPTELGDSGVWASLLDSMFDLIDSHDHSASKGVQVPMFTGVRVAADIPWSSGGTFYAIKDLKAIDFQPSPQSAMTGFTGALFVDSANNELSYRTVGGAIIKFTNGSAFNFAAIGAIGGDYTTAGALVDYVDANGLYRMRQEVAAGAQQWAIVQTGGLDLFEFKLHPAVGVPASRIRQKSPAALAGSYDMTWPGALPGASSVVQVDNTGQFSFSAALVNVTTLTTSGPVTAGGGLTVVGAASASGLITATSGVTFGANQNAVFSGSGNIKHSTRTRTILATSGNAAPTTSYQMGNAEVRYSGAGSQWFIPIPVEVGERVINARVRLKDNATGPTTLRSRIRKGNADDTTTDITAVTTSSGSGAYQTITFSALNDTAASGDFYFAMIDITGAGGNICDILKVEIDYDRP